MIKILIFYKNNIISLQKILKIRLTICTKNHQCITIPLTTKFNFMKQQKLINFINQSVCYVTQSRQVIQKSDLLWRHTYVHVRTLYYNIRIHTFILQRLFIINTFPYQHVSGIDRKRQQKEALPRGFNRAFFID